MLDDNPWTLSMMLNDEVLLVIEVEEALLQGSLSGDEEWGIN